MTLLGIIGLMELVIILMVVLLLMLFPILALIDIVKSKFEGNMQLIWVIIVVCLNILGAIIYFIVGRNQKIQQ